MYSYEDRIRAVRLYIKLGKHIAATIRRLGYPTKNSLKSWHREYVQCHDLPTGYVRSKPKYSPEQKKVAVDHYLSHDRCAAETLRALGYPCRGTLAARIDELDPGVDNVKQHVRSHRFSPWFRVISVKSWLDIAKSRFFARLYHCPPTTSRSIGTSATIRIPEINGCAP
jgi:hypothetical protein